MEINATDAQKKDQFQKMISYVRLVLTLKVFARCVELR